MVDVAAPLEAARLEVESLMTDACRITRQIDGVRDDALDPTTLELVPPVPDVIEIYVGPCGVSARNPSGQSTQSLTEDAGDREWAARYTLKTPVAADVPQPGDTVEITACVRDPHLVGWTFRVIASTGGTFKLSRKTEIELRQTPPGGDG
ncbi:DUF6093 family protein [Frankia sp. Mgl5]|uniref:DUF6093 family protein n=1 Tax=Frankia sp. Mgl5 TaxID=2933793 RepID=UPI00200F5A8E|nr:DUF6093 family protein [Frankia sp. Mgl5]MCK9929326.1 DUF6093 family protein [Frankia sp. Mgl5]